ncbi:MMPL family transporter [Nocardia brasiliensis]|uniref:MMPL family transporter n=1 Tax=Nocardia brasiliensis TaxID=37326 RepID=UPI003D939AAC
MASARHPWRVVAAWVIGICVLSALSAAFGGSYRDAISAPGSSSDRGIERLREEFPDQVGAQAIVVAKDIGAPVNPAAVATAARLLHEIPYVRTVLTRASADGRIVLLATHFDVELPDLDAASTVDKLNSAARPLTDAGAFATVGGEVPESIQGPDGTAELVGVGVALVVLLMALGSALAAGLPLLIAAAALGAGLGLIGLLTAAIEVNSVSPTLGSMLGLGVGIDYALFVLARHRAALGTGLSPTDAAAHATATAGKSAVFAGLSVLIGITGMTFSGVPGFASMGFATALVILACVVATITLLPALLAALGSRVFGRRTRRAAARAGVLPADSFHSRSAERLTERVTRRPVLVLIAGICVLLALAAPALNIRLGQNDAGSESAGKPTKQTYDLVAEGFGPGVNGPLTAVIDHSELSPVQADALRDEIASTAGVASVSPRTASRSGTTSVFEIVPAAGPGSAETAGLVARLRAILPAGADLTGPTAALLDVTSALSSRLWVVIAAVLTATFVLLMIVFRSLLLPAKAVVSNLLSIAATYGVMTLLFQTELGATLIGLDATVPIAGWAPMVLFAIIFGLSMDYEVFMLSSVREQHDRGLSDRDSVIRGAAASSKIICSAAAIMVAVAAGFALDSSVMVKIIGVGMAVAILVDVTMIRMILVPSAMVAFGKANWYWPHRFGRAPATSVDSVLEIQRTR